MVGIYGIVNKINQKWYVGQSVNIDKRWNSHRSVFQNESDKGYNYPLSKAIRKYGLENFEFILLEECLVSELDEKEIEWVNKKSSFQNGYNQTIGGNGGAGLIKLSWQDLDEITELLKTSSLNQSEIADLYGISSEMVNGMNTGRFYRRDIEYPIKDYSLDINRNKCIDCDKEISPKAKRCRRCHLISIGQKDKPKKEILIEKVATKGFTATGREYEVSGNTIKSWLKFYNLPHLLNDVKKLYGNYVEKPEPKYKEHKNFTLIKGGKEVSFLTTREAADYMLANNLTNATVESAMAGVGRVVRGARNSYLGFQLK